METAHRYGESADETIGVNVRLFREEAGLSQSDLAEEMARRGIPWYQQTVGRVEAGRQQVRATELAALAEILHTSMNRFMWTGPEANATQYVYSAGTRLAQQYRTVAEAVKMLLADWHTAERVLASTEDSEYEHVQEARADVAARLEECTLDNAVGAGIWSYREMHGEAGDEEEADGAAQSES
jgi:transcriptional regulator with XRE-family HTH domain